MTDIIDRVTPIKPLGLDSARIVSLSNDMIEKLAVLTTGYSPDPASEQKEATYYDYPVLKAPVWRWEIILYFFMGGLAAGCYVIATIASLFGSSDDRVVARTGYYLSLLALLPCPLLLIKDLGRPERFLNMLRSFKVSSPMSMGTWGLLSFSLFSGITAVIQAARDALLLQYPKTDRTNGEDPMQPPTPHDTGYSTRSIPTRSSENTRGKWWGVRLLASLPQQLIAMPGSLLAIFLGGYTGVLLATTSVPLWSRSKLLGAIFVSSAFSTGTALISCVLRISGAPGKVLLKLEKMEWAALLIEMTGLFAFLRGAGRAARPLVGSGPDEHGRTFWRYMVGGGLLLPWLLQSLVLLMGPSRHEARKRGGIGLFISLLALTGGYFLRRTMIEAGHSSSKDARATLWNARR